MDMDLIKNRQELVARYNKAIGEPGPLVRELQRAFLAGEMSTARINQYVQQSEAMIEARRPMVRRRC